MKTSTVRKLALGLSLTAMTVAGSAYAEQAMDKKGDEVMTRSAVQEHSAAMFARMDVNKDGKLDKADREARQKMRFDRLDTDKSGQLSLGEFTARPQRPEGAKPEARQGDEGKQGRRHHWGKRGHGRHGGMMMMRMADTDKDGAISQAEFTAAALQRFDSMDANKDGQVTKEERQAARQAMREQWKAKREAAKAAAPAPAN